MNRIKILLSLIIVSLFGLSSACVNVDTDSQNQFSNTNRLLLPDSILLVRADSSIIKIGTEGLTSDYSITIITTIWGECHVCMAKFKEWEQLLSNKLFLGVQMVYIVTTPYPVYFLKVFYPEIKHSGVLLIDDKDSFFSLNDLKYSQSHLNTFFVDSAFNIILQGDPLVMPGMLGKYEEAINIHY